MADQRLCVIPARGGSRRVPGKNIKVLGGRPLLAYAVEAALAADLFARVVVSTDDPEIAAVAERWGAEVPFLRGLDLADDVTPVSAVTIDALARLDPDGTLFAEVCQLMPNCPLRTATHVRASHAAFAAGGAAAQISVVRYGWQNPWWALRRDDAGRLTPLFPNELARRSQDLPDLFCPTGAVWWARADALREGGTFHLPQRTGWEMPWQHGLDIDTPDDWALAEALLAVVRAEDSA